MSKKTKWIRVWKEQNGGAKEWMLDIEGGTAFSGLYEIEPEEFKRCVKEKILTRYEK